MRVRNAHVCIRERTYTCARYMCLQFSHLFPAHQGGDGGGHAHVIHRAVAQLATGAAAPRQQTGAVTAATSTTSTSCGATGSRRRGTRRRRYGSPTGTTAVSRAHGMGFGANGGPAADVHRALQLEESRHVKATALQLGDFHVGAFLVWAQYHLLKEVKTHKIKGHTMPLKHAYMNLYRSSYQHSTLLLSIQPD